VNRLEETIRHAEEQCRQSGSKLTQKRQAVLSGLLQSDRALSAYELTDYCKTELGEALPAMSVYRILDFLESEQLVHKLKLANRDVACIHIACNHRHAVPQFLICTKCHRVEEIDISQSTISDLRENVEAVGYKLASPQLELDCICGNCANANEGEG